MKPTIVRNRMIFMASQHLVSKQLAAPLSKELQEKYHQNSARVIEGDGVKVLRGEFKGIEGKVTNVSTDKRGIAIEGIKREKLKGGNVDIYIHPSNVMITSLNLDDKWRQNRLERQNPKTPREKQTEEQKEVVKATETPKEVKAKETPKEVKKEIKEKGEQKSKAKATKAPEKTSKKVKQDKPKTKKKEDK